MKKVLFLSLIIMVLKSVVAGAVPITKFSIDPASPAINGNITPDDVLIPGPAIHTQGSALGLYDDFFSGFYDNLNALSYGRDPITNPLYFSVDRVAVGLQDTDVNKYAKPGVEEAHGDVYKTLPPSGSNKLYIDEEALGLTPGFFGDDLDALELDNEPDPYTYFSIDALSANNGFGSGCLANDILISSGGGSFGIFAEGVSDIGLYCEDDLDALVLWDVVNPGILDHGIDKALFSLSTFSLSAYTFSGNPYMPGIKDYLSPADILFTDFPLDYYSNGQKFKLWASAAAIGLRPDDEVNALDTVIPEPSTIFLMLLGLLSLVGSHYCQRRRRIL